MIGSVITICTGNICRSPMAEALLREALAPRGVAVDSAGVGALVGHPADPLAVELMAEQGIDLGGHRGKQVDEALMAGADLVLVMDRTHTAALAEVFPHYRGKVHLLGRWEGIEIADPYRCPRKAFEEALAQIEAGVRQWTDRIGRLG